MNIEWNRLGVSGSSNIAGCNAVLLAYQLGRSNLRYHRIFGLHALNPQYYAYEAEQPNQNTRKVQKGLKLIIKRRIHTTVTSSVQHSQKAGLWFMATPLIVSI